MGEGVKIWSRVKWWEESERSIRYFHQPEKGEKSIEDSMHDNELNIVTVTNNMQEVQVKVYKIIPCFDKELVEKFQENVDQHWKKKIWID